MYAQVCMYVKISHQADILGNFFCLIISDFHLLLQELVTYSFILLYLLVPLFSR